jgi:hypothetical protein
MLRKLTTIIALLTLVSCACKTPPGPVSLPDLPPVLTENPPEFRLLKSQKPMPSTPPPAAHGESKRSG